MHTHLDVHYTENWVFFDFYHVGNVDLMAIVFLSFFLSIDQSGP